MTPNGTDTDGQPIRTTPQPTAGYRSAITARPAARLDGNSAIGRRVRDLYRALMVRLGDPVDIVVQADIMALAELKVAAETARVRLLEGKSTSSNECVRLENLVRRAEARVGLVPAGAPVEESSPYGMLLAIDDEEGTAE